ncbi:hypothetical protein [Flavobacterium sp. 1355]|uniref:hypothetical protein n=1 Tax=Flavobacterium sp. 1355 TaxID=2806571 RepID=UPI001AE33303|nr:hypothetical protein [Flavobacterium sp. 1355]MBP1222900.1 hypothetical protein [Flavobacterium sp. 1355]
MSLLSSSPDERIFYYSEKPISKDYPHKESFYFKVIECDKTKFTTNSVTILRIAGIDNGTSSGDFLKYSHPHIPKSIKDAVMVLETLRFKGDTI